MSDISFLSLFPTLEQAKDLGESPQAYNRYSSQVQLLPDDRNPYLQVTSSSISLTIASDYRVYLVSCVTDEEIDITDNVTLTQFTEGTTQQIKIKIASICADFGQSTVYFKVDRGGGGGKQSFYYSNLFLITNENSELTSRIDYVDPLRNIPAADVYDEVYGVVQSIRLQFYYNNHVSKADLDVYFEISTGQNVNPRVLKKEYMQWQTQPFNAYHYKRLSRAFYAGKCYVNQVRNYPVEAFDPPPREGHTNISEMTFITDPNELDKITLRIEDVDCDHSDPTGDILFLSSSGLLSSESKKSSSQYENA